MKEFIKENWFLYASFVVAFLTLIATLGTILVQLRINNEQSVQEAKIASAQYVLDMSNRLDENKFSNISNVIEGNTHAFSILKPKGQFTQNQLEDYIGEYDTIADLERDNVITFSMAYDEFSYDFEKIWCNTDVQSDIVADQQESGIMSGPDAYFSGFEDLAKTFLKKDNYTCSNMDKQ